jgi:hypothetical protein
VALWQCSPAASEEAEMSIGLAAEPTPSPTVTGLTKWGGPVTLRARCVSITWCSREPVLRLLLDGWTDELERICKEEARPGRRLSLFF